MEIVGAEVVFFTVVHGELVWTCCLVCPSLVVVFACADIRKGGGATATFDSCTCCVIKPHAVKAGSVGKIIDKIINEVKDNAQGATLMAAVGVQGYMKQGEERTIFCCVSADSKGITPRSSSRS